MKKSNIYYFSVLSVVMTMFSCVDMGKPEDGRVTLEEIFNSHMRTKSYMGTCRGYIPQLGPTYDNTFLASFCDEAQDSFDGLGSSVNSWYNGRATAFSFPMDNLGLWYGYWNGIYRCNSFLKHINDPNMATYPFNEVEKGGWIAEVRVLRAFYFLQMIKRWGGVPVVSEPFDIPHDFSTLKRASFEECVDFIISECDKALAEPLPEPGSTIGFRWTLSGEMERGMLTRSFAHAVRSQAALYAASPLWYKDGSKYTWEKAAEITRDALDQLINRGYRLYNRDVDPSVAQNTYAYYFINRADVIRAQDRETIWESTALRTSIWTYAGLPLNNAWKAGSCPSQELVDCYEMADGTVPILGYEDANHLQPIYNPASSYDPNNPYANRDPRFYASIYYNGAPYSLQTGGTTEPTIKDYPLTPSRTNTGINSMTLEETDDYLHIMITGGDPFFYTSALPSAPEGTSTTIIFEYKGNIDVDDLEFFFVSASQGGPKGEWRTGLQQGMASLPKTDDWKEYELNITTSIVALKSWGGGDGSLDWGRAGDYLRFDITNGSVGEFYIRNLRIQTFAPAQLTPVETFVGGNCGISDEITNFVRTRTGYYIRKFNNYKSNAQLNADGLMKLYRMGELYLNFAEAAYQATGDPDKPIGDMSARQAVNVIRARVGMPALPAGLSKADFEKRYRNERRIELAFEEHRFFDVRRWKILGETDGFVTGMRITKNEDGTFTYNRFKLKNRETNTDKYLMFPINRTEVTKMNALTGVEWQNPGW